MARGYHALVSGILLAMAIPGFTQAQPAKIFTADGRVQLDLSEDDVLWAARATSYEVLSKNHSQATDLDEADVLWTLTQRAVFWRLQGKDFSFATSTRLFSQPLSPAFASRESEGCQKNPEACTDVLLARRAEAREASWEQLQARDRERKTRVVEATVQWAEGKLTNPLPGVMDFAQPRVAQRMLANNSNCKLRKKRGGHWFVSCPPATRWPIDYVQMISADERYLAGVSAEDRARFRVVAFARDFLDAMTLNWWG